MEGKGQVSQELVALSKATLPPPKSLNIYSRMFSERACGKIFAFEILLLHLLLTCTGFHCQEECRERVRGPDMRSEMGILLSHNPRFKYHALIS